MNSQKGKGARRAEAAAQILEHAPGRLPAAAMGGVVGGIGAAAAARELFNDD